MPPVDWKKIVSDTVDSGELDQQYPQEKPAENHLDAFRERVRKSIEDENISLSSVSIPEPPVERSLPGEVLVAAGRGAGKAVEYTGRGIQELGAESVGGALRSAGESIQQADFLVPSEELKTGQAGLVRRTLAGAAESIPMSAVPMALGAAGTAAGLAAGAATTANPIGAAVGGAIGGLAGMATGVGTLFYEGTKSAERERALKEFEVAHPEWTPEQRAEEAEEFATTQAKWEALPEAASQALTAGIGMAVAKGVAKGGLTAGKTVLRDLLGTGGPKEMLKHVAKEYASEGGTELLTYFAQAENEKKYGIGEGPTFTGALDTAITAAWFTGAAGAGMAGLNYRERNKTISGLNSENKLIRDKAAEKVEAKVAEKFGPDSAKQWRSIFESSVAEGKGGGFSIDSPLFGAAAEAYAPEGGGVLEKALGATQPAAPPDENAQFEAASMAADEAAMEANPEYEAASALAGEAASEANLEAQFETESVAARKRAAGIPLDAVEEAALAAAAQRLARPAPVTAGRVSPAQNTVQAVHQDGGITAETPEQAQQGYEAYQPKPPVNPASEYGQQQAEFERTQREAAEYNRLKNIPDKLPELPEDLRSADSFSRPQLLAVAKKYNIPTVNDTGKAVGVKAAVKRFAESEQKRIASETRLRTPEEQARLDQLAGRTPERLAAQAQRERGVEFQRAADDLEAAPLKAAPGGEAYFAGVENIAAEREAQGEFASREGEDVAVALPVMMRELSEGTAGRRLRNAGESYGYDADAGAMIGEPSSYPKWVQKDPELSKAGRKTIEQVAELARTGGKMTERQIDLWSRLKAAAQKEYSRNPELQQGVEFDRLAADGYNFEAGASGLLASDLGEGDSVALMEDGAIVRYTSQGVDENTGRVVLEKDGGGTKELGGFDPVEPVAVKLARSEEVPFSKAQAPMANAADVRAELAKRYSAGWIDRAERQGLFRFIDPATAERLVVEMGIDPKRAAGGRIEGFVAPDGQIYFVQGGIEAGQVLGVAAHELGSHAMRSGFVKEQDWRDVLAQSDRLLAKGDESVVEARRRAVEAGTPDSLLREETVAYLSNFAPKHGIIRSLIAKLKQFMINNNLASKFFISELTPADLQALAQGATKAAIKGKAAPDWAKGVDARLSAKITPDLRVEATNKKGETVTRPLSAKAIAAQEPLSTVKGAVETRTEELRSGLTEGDMLARRIEEEAQKKVNPRKQAQIEKDLLEQIRVFRKQHLQPEIQDMANEIFGTIDPEARRMTPAKETNLKATRAEIERLKAEGADIDPALEAKVARLDRRRIGDMLPGEAQALLDVANELAYVNKTKNKLLAVKRGQDAAELSKGIIAPIEAKPSKRYTEAKKTGKKAERGKNPIFDLGRQLLGDPASTFRTLMLDLGRANEKSSAVKLAQTVAERQNIELKHRKDLDELLVKSIGKNWQALAESKKWNAEQDVNGRKLTSGEKVYLKYSLNDQNVSDSIEKMGYRKKLDTKATKMSRAEREAIKLNPEEQRVYDALADYFESTYQVLNPAHVEMKGWTLPAAGRGKYLPKSVSNLTLADELGSIIRSGSVENTGVVQDRIGTLNEINLKDIFEVITRQRDIASKYAAYAPMVRDFNLVFRSPELKNTLQMEYGVEKNGKSIVENYVDDYLRDLQGNKPRSDSGVEGAAQALRVAAAAALLAGRFTTIGMQMTGYPRALAHLSPQNLAKALRMRGGFEEAVKWNMRAYARRDAGIDREIFDNRNKRLIRLGMAGIQKMDELVTGRLWSATKLQTAQETGLRGDELLAETNRRFDAVLDTQGGHTMADLSMTSRTGSELAKMLTIFSSDKFAMLNEIKRGLIIREHTGDWRPLARVSAGMVLSAAMAAGVATAVGGAVSGKDKDYKEEFVKNLTGSLPLFDQLVSMFQGFNPSSAGIEAIGDAANAAGRIASLARKQAVGETVTAEQYSKALQAVVNSASLAAGVPVKNITDNLGFAKRLALGKDALEQVESELRGIEDFDFEKRKARVTRGKQGAELRAALSKLRAEFAGLDQEKVAKARRLSAAKKRIKEIDKELEGEVPAAFRLRREKLREEIAARAVR